ncbi:hypothetical protein Tco_0841843 [Tanacetum coccineum]|uniref:Uncharacterized protein n=1 Tax=Tanacetum coccineum TaxID=301880 RepID=A0ABQ5B1U3_9ASTR
MSAGVSAQAEEPMHTAKDLEEPPAHQERVDDLQLGVESYQKKLNLTNPDTYRLDLKRREAYTAYSNPRGFIYQNKYKKNKLMRIDELYKFSDSTLNDVWTALDDHLKGIRMKFLPQTIWRQSDRDKVGAMIHAIDKQLKTRRIMRSLEKFVGGQTLYFNPMILAKTEGINPKNTPLDSVEVLKDMIQKEKKKIGTSIMPTEMDLNTGTT